MLMKCPSINPKRVEKYRLRCKFLWKITSTLHLKVSMEVLTRVFNCDLCIKMESDKFYDHFQASTKASV